MRTLYDAVSPGNIPADAQMVAGYVDGHYAWSAADWARFPHAVKVRIAVFPRTNDGHVLDCESGDATPAQCPGWVLMRRATGMDPSVYTSLSQWSAVRTAFHDQGVTEPHYWIAAYPGCGAQLYEGAVAHQYEDYRNLYDLSVVADFWPGVDGPAPPAQPPLTGPIQVAGVTVQDVQARLVIFGIPLVTDNIWGPATLAAVREFQGANSLMQDGIVGPVTWALLSVAVHAPPAPAPPAPPAPAAGDGNPWSPLAVDGQFGDHSIRSVQWRCGVAADGAWGDASKKALQRRLKVAADGSVGPNTIKALQSHVGAKVDGSWGPGTTRCLQDALNRGRF